jgi:hypothetical protein
MELRYGGGADGFRIVGPTGDRGHPGHD